MEREGACFGREWVMDELGEGARLEVRDTFARGGDVGQPLCDLYDVAGDVPRGGEYGTDTLSGGGG